jgi:PAS domain S-box-containing protein
LRSSGPSDMVLLKHNPMENQDLIIDATFGEEECDMLFNMDIMGLITKVRLLKENFSEKLGYHDHELIGQNVTDFLVDSKSVAGAEHFGRLYASEKAFRASGRKLKAKSGETVIVESYLVPMYDAEQKLIGHRGMEFFKPEKIA